VAATNTEIARVLRELTVLLQLEDGSPQSFRVRAYDKGTQAVAELGVDVAAMTQAELVAVNGIGKGIATKIREYVDTGNIAKLDELRERYPPAFVELTRIPGLGPKTLALVRAELGVENVDDLRRAVAQQQLRDLPGLGAKTEENVARSIERLGLHGKERRTPVGVALATATEIAAELRTVPGVEQVQHCGSLRRFRDTVADIDLVVAASDARPVMARFVGLSLAHEVIAHGDTKSALLTRDGLQVDLRVVAPGQFGAAVLYFTGSKAHNIRLRQRALDRGWTLNEYALSDQETEEVIGAATEEQIYAALGLEFVAPPLREDAGEIEAARAGELPDLVTVDDIKGDLHVHTTLSGDGRSTLDKMAEAAAARGLEYIAITDHGEDLAINGATRDQLLRQRRRLAKVGDQTGVRLLHGCELNIGKEGGVDYDPKFLAGFDWTVASVHSHFDLDPATQTARLLAAIRNPMVSGIGHLSGRKIGRRPGIEFDVDAVLTAAAETGTAIEINGAIDRLDATSAVIRHGVDRGVVFAISTDSHHVDEFTRVQWGVLNAQRGWASRDAVATTWPVERLLEWVAAGRRTA
jgi:DNA polymerase (family 10)